MQVVCSQRPTFVSGSRLFGACLPPPSLFYTHWRNARCSYDAVYVVYFKTNARILRADCPNLVAFCIDVASSVGGEGGCSVSASLPQHHF